MNVKVFVDTNVLIYSRDASEPEKQRQAKAWMTHLWREKAGRLSFQVLQEYYSAVTQKLKPGLSPESARQDVRALIAWNPIFIDARVLEGAWVIQDRCRFSWWDSLIVSAAQAGVCNFLLTEDLQADQEIGNLRVINPFSHSPEALALEPS